MAELIHLEEGRWPWEPAGDARLVQVIDEFNVPTAGVIEEQGSHYLFRCLEGHADDLSLWVYAALSVVPTDTRSLDDAFALAISHAPLVTVALASSEHGILRVVEKVELAGWRSPAAAAVAALDLTAGEREEMGIEEDELIGF